MRYKKIKTLVEQVVEPSVDFIKRSRGRTTMPFRETEAILKVFFPRTKYEDSKNGYFKHVFIIHSSSRRLVLKMGRKRKDIRKDYFTYKQLCDRANPRQANEHFAKIYWRTGLFMPKKRKRIRRAAKGAKKAQRVRAQIWAQGYKEVEHHEVREHF